MDIRAAQLEDITQIITLVTGQSDIFLGKEQTELPSWFINTFSPTYFAKRFSSDTFYNYVCTDGEKILGYISLKYTGHLVHLFVEPHQHRSGIGKALWQHVSQLCPAQLITVRASLNAVPFYLKMGFSIAGKAEEKEGLAYQPMEYVKELEQKPAHRC
ncbi:GNAT family N-acetyltransferase [Teredinibacter sp. KSP-S5-2]|uniref:GNAT family N-acetyltransferase n=1 Tax=Teredinibacter sp. KSP-S5-2 TaxID=3034506 RepID=UPI0029342595|nr:GNAT family N-acetyltransferase [Teredinibacter sp. KSP-S5-2]WNO10321.1 GNAT family N-acetyltransferase [Teredinibacter sp. KSP-S5-2]